MTIKPVRLFNNTVMSSHREINSIFYVDSDYESLSIDSTNINNNKMENKVRTLKEELSRTRESLKLATKRCRDLVRELDSRIESQDSERWLRDNELSRILRALLVLESRLKQEQKSIRQLLCEKDNVIRNQQLEMARLRRYTSNYIKAKRAGDSTKIKGNLELEDSLGTLVDGTEPTTTRRDNDLGREIGRLKGEIMDKLGIKSNPRQVRKSDSFAGSDVSKASSSENTDPGSVITSSVATDESWASFVSTEGFCEGESSSNDSCSTPGSTLDKSRLTAIGTVQSISADHPSRSNISRSESNDDGMDCNFGSEEEENINEIEEPIYVNAPKDVNKNSTDQQYNNNNHNRSPKAEEETIGNWYSDPDEDRTNEEATSSSCSYRRNGNRNSVLECVNEILLRDMEEEEESTPRRFKGRAGGGGLSSGRRVAAFESARLSDIESVGSEMERRNVDEEEEEGAGEKEKETDKCDDLEEKDKLREAAAIPIIVIEPKKIDWSSQRFESLEPRASIRQSQMERIEEKTCSEMSSKRLTIAKNLDYEDIESLPECIVSLTPFKTPPPALPPKPTQFRNTLILKKIPSPSFLIDETRRKNNFSANFTGKELFSVPTSVQCSPAKSRKITNRDVGNKTEHLSPRVTSIVKHFEEFKIGVDDDSHSRSRSGSNSKEREDNGHFQQFDMRLNFEEFNLDECDLSEDPDRPDADGSENFNLSLGLSDPNSDNNNYPCDNSMTNGHGIYQHFLEATGLSNKSILTPSRLLSNHKSMLKPKDVKYKNRIKSTLNNEQNHLQTDQLLSQVRHWTGPFV